VEWQQTCVPERQQNNQIRKTHFFSAVELELAKGLEPPTA
jgi:hypothetical protein